MATIKLLLTHTAEFDEGPWDVYRVVEFECDPAGDMREQVRDELLRRANGFKGMHDSESDAGQLAHWDQHIYVVMDDMPVDDMFPDRAKRWQHENREQLAKNRREAEEWRNRK